MNDCAWISHKIGDLVSLDDQIELQLSSFSHIPSDFFEDVESTWKGRVKRDHMEDLYEKVEEAAKVLHQAVGVHVSSGSRLYCSMCIIVLCTVPYVLLCCFLSFFCTPNPAKKSLMV